MSDYLGKDMRRVRKEENDNEQEKEIKGIMKITYNLM